MKISLENAVKALSEYIAKEFTGSRDLTGFGAAVYAEYKLATKGVTFLRTFDDGTGYIDLDSLERALMKYSFNGQTFKTPVGEISITGDTPQQILAKLKEYGENK